MTAGPGSPDTGAQRPGSFTDNLKSIVHGIRQFGSDRATITNGKVVVTPNTGPNMAASILVGNSNEPLSTREKVAHRKVEVGAIKEQAKKSRNPLQDAFDSMVRIRAITDGIDIDRLQNSGNTELLTQLQTSAHGDIANILRGIGYSDRRIASIMEQKTTVSRMEQIFTPNGFRMRAGREAYQVVAHLQQQLGSIVGRAYAPVAETQMLRNGHTAGSINIKSAIASIVTGVVTAESLPESLLQAIQTEEGRDRLVESMGEGVDTRIVNAADTLHGVVAGVTGFAGGLRERARALLRKSGGTGQPEAATMQSNTEFATSDEDTNLDSPRVGQWFRAAMGSVLDITALADVNLMRGAEQLRGKMGGTMEATLRARRRIVAALHFVDMVDPTGKGRLRQLMNAAASKLTGGRFPNAVDLVKDAGDELLASLYLTDPHRVTEELFREQVAFMRQQHSADTIGYKLVRQANRPAIVALSAIGHRVLGVRMEEDKVAGKQVAPNTPRVGLNFAPTPPVTPTNAAQV